MTKSGSTIRPTQTVDRALSLLDVLADSRHPLNLKSISSRSGLNASTCLRLLRTLELNHYVVRLPDSDLYRLGPKILTLSYALESQIDIRTIARPSLEYLSEVIGESAGLVIRQGDEGVLIERSISERALRHVQGIGHRGPLYCTSAGKILLAWEEPEWQERYIDEVDMVPLTATTITSPDFLREELAAVREQGYAIDRAEREEGLSAIAVPVRDAADHVVASLGVSGPSERLPESAFADTIRHLIAQAEVISIQLGWQKT